MVGYGTERKNSNRELSANEYGEAGIASGIATRCLIQPLDVLKIRFQLQEESLRGVKKGKYTGVIQAIVLIFKEEGIAAFWKGHVPAQGLSAVYGLVQFTSFEMLTKKSKDFTISSGNRGLTDFICGALSGCSAMISAMPLDVIRTRLIAQGNPKVYRGMFDAIAVMWRVEGVRGFFRGLPPSLVHIAPYTGLQFALFNWFVDAWTALTNKEETQGALLCGALAGATAKVILYPFDMVRHRLQLRGFERRGFGRTTQYYTMVGTFIHVVRHERVFGLFKGLLPSILKASASSGFAFLFYDVALDVIRAL